MESLTKNEKFLLIVESPNKVKTISSILKAAGYQNAKVLASVGHIMTLGNGGPAFNSGVYPKQNFKMNLSIIEEKQKIVNEIALQAQKATRIFIMTDGDREGEVIAWSLIKFCKLPQEKCYRVITQEITSKAVIKAIENPTVFDNDLVNAGLVRMMIDKLIGYGLSPLSKKYLGAKSIGRCQSVGLKLISDRENEINNFIPELYFKLDLEFKVDDQTFIAKYLGYKDEVITKIARQADVNAIINDCNNTPYTIESIDVKKHFETPKEPFCTATFQQEAANKLGLKVKDAMGYAQKLFEGIKINNEHKGLITYMRTDSSKIAAEFLPELKQFIDNSYGQQEYVGIRKIKNKSTAQEGHEALRITDPNLTPGILSNYITNPMLIKVYNLIWQRTIASVMSNATINENIYIINNNQHKFILKVNEITDLGYKKAYKNTAEQTIIKPNLIIGDTLLDTKLISTKKFTQPKPRYTEASLVKELQQKEIGRPSTYASIVETVLSATRGYAKTEEKFIVPTDRGIQLANYCDRSFPSLINLNYTKEMEASLDKIASGKTNWLDYMEIFYNNLKDIIDSTNETGIASEMPEKICPMCGKSMVVRRSRFGKLFYGCSAYPKCTGILSLD